MPSYAFTILLNDILQIFVLYNLLVYTWEQITYEIYGKR